MAKNRSSRKKIILALIPATIMATGLGIYFFINLGRWLVVNDPLPQKADLLFVFSGDGSRVDHAAQLMSGQYPDALLVCAAHDAVRIRRKYPEIAQKITIHVADSSDSTIEELRLLRRELRGDFGFDYHNDNGIKDILLVSSPWHMRRISIMNSIVMRGEKSRRYNFHHIAAFTDAFSEEKLNESRWWTQSWANIVRMEVKKIGFYFFVVLNPFLDERSIKEELR